jgi:hypothetical protein
MFNAHMFGLAAGTVNVLLYFFRTRPSRLDSAIFWGVLEHLVVGYILGFIFATIYNHFALAA